jgi:hypothetical protein
MAAPIGDRPRCRRWPCRFWCWWSGRPHTTRQVAPSGTAPPEGWHARIVADYHAALARQARARTIDLVRAGYHIGPAPYGYRARRAHPALPGVGARSRVRLVPDPVTAPVVSRIFHWRLEERLSCAAIAARLGSDPVGWPAPIHPATGRPRSWNPRIVRAILANPVYTGRTIWGRTRHGHQLPAQRWITSAPVAHRALTDDRTFARVTATFTSPARHA